jgi:hypothetical protein
MKDGFARTHIYYSGGSIMRKALSRFAGACAAVVAALLVVPSYSADPEFTPPKPGPEHEILKKLEGTWNVNSKFRMAPDQAEQESKGTMTWKMECGGLWLVGNLDSEMLGQKFQGKSLDTYDTNKKKYTSIWVDSMATMPMIGEGTFDKEKKTMTFVYDYPGPDGKMAKHTMKSTLKDDDTLEATMSVPGKDGKDFTMMTITYKRKK